MILMMMNVARVYVHVHTAKALSLPDKKQLTILPDSTVTSGQEAVDYPAGFDLEMETPVETQLCCSSKIQTWSRSKSINSRA